MPFIEYTPVTQPSQTYLVDLDLSRVALCNEGANSRAHILLTKRKENKSMPKNFEELISALQPEEAEVVKSHITAIEKAKDDAIVELKGQVTKLEGTVGELEKSAKASKGASEEEILKSASPEIASYVKSLKQTVDTLVTAQNEELAKQRFETVKAIPAEEAELKEVLKSASPAVFEVLKKASKAIEESVLASKGRSSANDDFTVGADAAYNKLEKSAKEIMSKSAGMTFEAAFTEACSVDSKTYAEYVKGAR